MKMSNWFKKIALVLAFSTVLVLTAGCGGTGGSSPAPAPASTPSNSASEDASGKALEGQTVKIGIFVPLTGTMADKGKRIVDGITMAANEVNEAGGIEGAKVELVVEDDEGIPASAVNAVTKLINSDRVHAVMGSNPSSCTIAAMTVTERNEVTQIAANSSSPKIASGDNRFVFQTIPNDAIQAGKLVDFAVQDKQIKKFAIIHPNDDYGMGGRDGALAKLKEFGIEDVLIESYNPGDKDFTAQINKIKAQDPGALIIWGQAAEAALIINQIRQQGMTETIVLGAGGIPGSTFISLGGDNVEGTYVTNTFIRDTSNPKVEEFMTKFEETYGYEPDLTSAQAYDGANMLFDSIGRAKSLDTVAIRDAVEATPGFVGITGEIKFAEDHSVPSKKVYITQLQKGSWNLIK